MKSSSDWSQRALDKSSYNENNCLEFHGSKARGYGKIYFNGKLRLIHRLSYELHNSEIKENLLVRHKCDNRACWNPDHLELGTYKDNMKDMVDRGHSGRTHNNGISNGRSKLSEQDVKEIKKLIASGIKHKEIAGIYSVDRSQVSKIRLNKTWKHVK